jgi:hypothetical protein
MIANDRARRHASRSIAALLVLAITFASFPARAGEGEATERIVAENLFAEAKARMEEGHFDEACPKLVESQRVAPAGGTILLLGLCHEQEGKLASAWAELRAALSAARRAGRADRIATASEHIAAIEPKLAHATVVLESNADLPGLDVVLDGVTLTRASCNSPLPLDPGLHEIGVSAPGRVPWHTGFVVRPESSDASIVVPVLDAPPREPPHSRVRPIAIGTAVGVFAVALGLTAYWGVRAIVSEQSKPATCRDDDTACTSQARSFEEQRTTMSTLATIAAGVGAAAAGAAITLWLTAPPSSAAPSASSASARGSTFKAAGVTFGAQAPGAFGGSFALTF